MSGSAAALAIELVAAAQLPVMQAMATYYVYDMSEFLGDLPGWEFPDNGLYESEDLTPYFDDPGAYAYFIRASGELAGFAIVDRKGADPGADFNMAQFFVHRKFKRRGIGAWAAAECFRRHPGVWDVMVIPGNLGAHAFWERTIGDCADGSYQETRRRVLHLGDSEQDVFRFRTP